MGEAATGASDLYALGVVAHEMLSGSRPFDRGTPVATALSHVNEPPPPLPDGVPEDLASLVRDCLAKNPAERPANAREVASRVGLGDNEMAGLSLGLASALDSWAEDDSPNTDGSVIRFPDLGGPTVAMEVKPGSTA